MGDMLCCAWQSSVSKQDLIQCSFLASALSSAQVPARPTLPPPRPPIHPHPATCLHPAPPHIPCVQFKMTSVIGHVLSIDFPPAYQSWEHTDPATLFDAPTLKNEANPKVCVYVCAW